MLITVAAAAALFLAGCAPRAVTKAESQGLLPEIDIVQMKENSDEALRLAQEAKLDVETANSKVTELDNRMVVLSDEVSAVSMAKIEELENRLSLVIEALKELQVQMNTMGVSPHAVKKSGDGQQATFSTSSASSILSQSPEQEAYQNALSVCNARNYKQAITQFNDILQQYPQGKYADNCNYWIGECYFSLGDYAQAIASFQRVQEFKNSSKADDALLRTGMAYLKMGQKTQAKEALQTLLDRYPGSDLAPRAKEYMSQVN
jgi:tol-pal system protein YbgF